MSLNLNENCIVYCACTDFLQDAVLYSAAYETVPEVRRQRADRAVSEKTKRLLVGAALLLRYALSEAGIGDKMPEFVYGSDGKPYLKNYEDVFFNLSHSGEYVLCALSDREVGCDIERVGKANIRLAERYFCAEEYARILSEGDGTQQKELFFRYWTIKESFLKATGRGLNLPLNAFCVQMDRERITVQQHYDGEAYSFAEFEAVPGYRCAVCARAERISAEFRFADLRTYLENNNA